MKNIIRNNKGFTIIEVVLVLAIAGLIFLVVFLALPQLQASRRDTQRKSDASRFLAAIENSAGNHNGVYPPNFTDNAAGQTWAAANVSGTFDDPSNAAPYTYVVDQAGITTAIASTDPGGVIYYSRQAKCTIDGSDGFLTGLSERQVAVQMTLEAGIFCQDNQ